MKTFSIPVLMASVGASFVLGFAIAWQVVSSDSDALGDAAVVAQPTSSTQPSNANQLADLWNKTGSPTSASQPTAAAGTPHQPVNAGVDEQKLRERAQSDPIFLRNLIQRYETERDPATRDAIKSVLATIQKPEALAFFSRLANSGDPAQRKEGYAMLQQMAPDSAEMRNVLKQALASEQSPEVLAQAIAALRPTAVDPTESDAIVAQLNGLAQHADPSVRSQSILQLAQWDKNGAKQERLTSALTDPVPEVRQAAIFAVAQSGARTDNVKAALMGIISNTAENKDVKGSALQVLERFSLTKEEYVRYTQARAQIGL